MTTIFQVRRLNKRYIFRVGKRAQRIATQYDKSDSVITCIVQRTSKRWQTARNVDKRPETWATYEKKNDYTISSFIFFFTAYKLSPKIKKKT